MKLRHSVSVIAALSMAMVLAAGAATADDPSLVVTRSGPIKGVEGDGYRAFLGVPYAQPPVGSLRWAAPVAVKPWAVPLDARAVRPECLQFSWGIPKTIDGSEDCLYLNVYTPLPKAGEQPKNLPVLMFMHGGAFIAGASQNVDPSYMAAREGIVVVSINYRLGPFGFFASPALDAESPKRVSGNYTLLDERAALQWIHDNIAAFGGDPAQVTISGQSVGAGSTWIHLVSPGSQGLFHKVIAQSGPPTLNSYNGAPDQRPTRSLKDAEQRGPSARLFASLHCAQEPNPLDCARAKSAKDVLLAIPNEHGAGWGPVIDDVVLPGNVSTLIREGRYNRKTPIMTGFTATEAGWSFIMRYGNGGAPLSAGDYVRQVKAMPNGEKILTQYPVSLYPSPDDAYIAEAGDSRNCAVLYTAKTLSALSPVYVYEFDDRYPPPTLFSIPIPPNIHPGAYHTTDIAYVFQRGYPNEIHPGVPPFSTPEQKALSDRMMGYWANFVKTGNPTPDSAWQQPSRSQSIFVEAPHGDRMVADSEFESENHCSFWRSLPMPVVTGQDH